MPSLKKNLFYSILLILANYVFPFLTYPYVSRVLGVENIGACNFVDSVINYFILFSMLGLDSLGVREIAKHRDNKEELDRTFSNLFVVNVALTSFMLIVLAIMTFAVPKFAAHKDLMLFGAFKLLFNSLLVEWLYKGLENFRLITIRSLIIKTLYVVLVFILVRTPQDVWIYYLLSCLLVVVNALVNILFAHRSVHLSFSGIKFLATFKSLFTLGLYAILTSMYTTFNVTFLGFVAGEVEVGYYTTATKIYYMVMALFSAFTGVMMPRMSNLVSSGDMDKFKSFFHLSVEVLFGFSLPIIIWMMIMSSDIVGLIAGPGYAGAVLPMTIIAPLVFVIGYEQVLVLQTLVPLGKDRILLRNSIIGAGSGLLLNVLLVPIFAAVGSSIVWIVSELLILVLSQIAVAQSIEIPFPIAELVKNIAVYIPLAVIVGCCMLLESSLLRLFFSAVMTAAYVLAIQVFVKKRNPFALLKKSS